MFSYNLQFGGTAFNEIHDKGEASKDKILSEFEQFDWVNEVKNNEGRDMCCPTFSITHTPSKIIYWVSADGGPSDIEWMAGMQVPTIKKKVFFGLFNATYDKSPGLIPGIEYDNAKEGLMQFLEHNYAGAYKSIYGEDLKDEDIFQAAK